MADHGAGTGFTDAATEMIATVDWRTNYADMTTYSDAEGRFGRGQGPV